MRNIDDYRPIVGDAVVDNLFLLAHHLGDKVIQNINSTATGGGVAEILNRMIPLLNQLGINARWDVIKGGEKFFNITKKFHNALHGVETDFSPDELEHFLAVNHQNAVEMNLYGDIIFIHDPQPIALIERRPDAVLVVGDVNSTIAATLAAVKLHTVPATIAPSAWISSTLQ